MAIIYVWSGATGLANGSSWTDAYTTWQAGLTAWTTADIIYMAKDHSESITGTIGFTCGASTRNTPNITVVVDRADNSYSPKEVSPQITVTNTLAYSMHGIFFGLHLRADQQIQHATANGLLIYYDTIFDINGTSQMRQGSGGLQTIELYNCDIDLATNGLMYLYGSYAKMIGGSLSGVAHALGALYSDNGRGTYEFIGVDMSGMDLTTNSADLVGFGTTALASRDVNIINCDIPASATLPTISNAGFDIRLISSDDAGKLYRHEHHQFTGSTVYTSSVYRDAGYTDQSDDTQISHKMTPASNVNYNIPLAGIPIQGYVTSTGSRTITMEIVHNFTTALKDNEFLFDINSVGTTAEVVAAMSSTASGVAGVVRDPQITGTTLTTSTEAWTGASGLTKQKVSITVTFDRTGPFLLIPYLATYEASKVLYYDPKVSVA